MIQSIIKQLSQLMKSVLVLLLPLLLTHCKVGGDKVKGYIGVDGGSAGGPISKSDRIIATFSDPSPQVVEGGQIRLIARFDKAIPKDTSINWTIQGASSELSAASGTVAVTKGDEQFEIPLTAVNENIYEGDETYSVSVTVDPALFFAPPTVNLKIVEVSSQPAIRFENSVYTATEGGLLQSAVVEMSTASAFTTSVSLNVSGTASANGGDYSLSPFDEVVFFPGQTRKHITIFINDDALAESMEDIQLSLGSVTQGLAGVDASQNQASVFILDNDSAASFNISGVVGGADAIADAFLTANTVPTVQWQAYPGATQYQVAIFEDNGSTVKCSPQIVSSATLTYTFSGCTLTSDAYYRASVVATVSGVPLAAANDYFRFKFDITAPAAFSIIGIAGGVDTSYDRYLAGGTFPTVSWMDSTDESQYFASVYESNGTTVKCAQVSVPANITALSFPSCGLTQNTTYKARVWAKDEAGNVTNATNNFYSFSVTSVPTGYIITGLTGGTADTTEDDSLNDGFDGTVHWQDATGEVNYDVTIYENDGTTVKCATVNLPADTTSHTFTGCKFDLHNQYKVTVVARDTNNNLFAAANSPFQFRYKFGLFISGTGGSYYRGIPLTTCGGANGDECTSTTPYTVVDTLREGMIRVSNNGVISGNAWASGAAALGNGMLEIEADRLWVDSNGTITMVGKGYTSGNGPSAGAANANVGGAHGGRGGRSHAGNPTEAYGNLISPVTMGSPGSSDSTYSGGSGGGVIKITVAQELFLNGVITAGGGDGLGSGGSTTGAGGAGGSLRVIAKNISGFGGYLRARGGSGTNVSSSLYYGACGSGGRIAIEYENDYTIGGLEAQNLQAYGGNTSVCGSLSGAAGSIYIDKSNDVNPGYLIVDNGPFPYVEFVETPAPIGLNLASYKTKNFGTMVVNSTETFSLYSASINYRLVVAGQITLPSSGQDLTIANGGYLEWRQGNPLTFNTIDIQNGGTISHTSNGPSEQYKLEIQAQTLKVSGTIDLMGRGYAVASGPGGATSGNGASHGGYAGTVSGGVGPAPYGSITQPSSLGSGASQNKGAGAVKITTQTLELNGLIRGNGTNQTNCYGAPAGGSVWINTQNISGSSGTINVNGGSRYSTCGTGGGSGGRIAIYYTTDSYALPNLKTSLAMTAMGGDGSTDGAAGTIFLKKLSDPRGTLIVKNGTNSYEESVTTALTETTTYDAIETDSSGTLHIPSGMTYELPSINVNYRLVVEGAFSLPSGQDDLIIANGGYLEWRRSTQQTLDELTVATGGVLTHSTNRTTKSYYLDFVTRRFTLVGSVNVNGRGYSTGYGTGAGAVQAGSNFAAGGSHGGLGQRAGTTSYGNTYDSFLNPNDLGSGGGTVSNCTGGQGGGLVKITASQDMEISGTLSANGTGGGYYSSSYTYSCGGGSGGSIKLVTQNLLGTGGTVTAHGGNGGASTLGNGGGGRIYLAYNSESYTGGFSALQVLAYGGTNSSEGSGGAGSVVIKPAGQSVGTLIADNGSAPHVQFSETPLSMTDNFDAIISRNNGTYIVFSGQNFSLLSSTLDYRLVVEGAFTLPAAGQDLTVASGGYLEWRKSSVLSLNSLTVQSGGVLSHSKNLTTKNYFLNLQVNQFNLSGLVDLDRRGYEARSGPGAGTDSASGGSYGGKGGALNVAAIGATYSTIKNPDELGSGGYGVAGGGYFKLVCTGTTTLNGIIRARGIGAGTEYYSGGSGGTISIDTATLAGSSTSLNADGGDKVSYGSGGGGGRIAIRYTTDSFSGGFLASATLSSMGGAGDRDGGAGTIFVKSAAQTYGTLISKNGTRVYNERNTTTLDDGLRFDNVVADSGTALEIPTSQSYTLHSTTLNYRLIMGGDVLLPSGSDMTVGSSGILEWRKASAFSLGRLTVNAGGVLTHTANASSELYAIVLNVTDFILDGTVDLTGKGYAAGEGIVKASSGGGGAHGGNGGIGIGTSTIGYGSMDTPITLGAGGGSSNGAIAGAGGGRIQVSASNEVILRGTIVTTGTRGGEINYLGGGSYYGGAGAGGSVLIDTNIISGNTAVINANGRNSQYPAGSGGGGRISIKYNVDNYAGGVENMSATAYGGTEANSYSGAAGTIYFMDKDTWSAGHLVINNFTNPYRETVETAFTNNINLSQMTVSSTAGIYVGTGVNFALTSSTLNFPLRVAGTVSWATPNLTISNTGFLIWDKDATITLDNLTIESGGRVTHTANSNSKTKTLTVSVAQDLWLKSGGVIDVSGKGYANNEGPGKGNVHNSLGGGGGSYGGVGGVAFNVLASSAYGLDDDPTELGSGGGTGYYGAGGSGGGYVALTVGQNLRIEGNIYANGNSGLGGDRGGGAGSGGTIRLTTQTLLGSVGLLQANGGSSSYGLNTAGGAGGGGRILIRFTTDSYTGTISALTKTANGGTAGFVAYGAAPGTVRINP